MAKAKTRVRKPTTADILKRHEDTINGMWRTMTTLEQIEVARNRDDKWWRDLTPWQRVKAILKDITSGDGYGRQDS